VRTLVKTAFFVGCCLGLYISRSRKFAQKMTELAEDIQDKVSAATIVRMIDVLLGEVVYTSIVSTQRITDFLLDLRMIATKISEVE
jgi:hypothetical protein